MVAPWATKNLNYGLSVEELEFDDLNLLMATPNFFVDGFAYEFYMINFPITLLLLFLELLFYAIQTLALRYHKFIFFIFSPLITQNYAQTKFEIYQRDEIQLVNWLHSPWATIY